MVRDVVGPHPATVGQPQADRLGVEILEQERHASERALGYALGDGARGLRVDRHHCVRRVIGGELERGLEELSRRDLPPSDKLGEAEGVVILVVVSHLCASLVLGMTEFSGLPDLTGLEFG